MGSSWILWIVALIISVAVALLGVASGRPDVLTVGMSVVAGAIASLAIAENWSANGSGADATTIASLNSRHMGLVWSFGALALLLTYTLFLEWKEWMVFTGAFVAVALLCLAFSIIVKKSGANDEGDDALLTLARYLTIGQLVGMVATMVGLIADGKMPASAQANPGWYDWAGNVIFFYGALALVAISANALYTGRSNTGRANTGRANTGRANAGRKTS